MRNNAMHTIDTPLKTLTKTEAAQFCEEVQGIIIGDYTVMARLYSKKTRNQVAFGAFCNDQEAREWAMKLSADKKRELGPEFVRLWGSDGFELRIWY